MPVLARELSGDLQEPFVYVRHSLVEKPRVLAIGLMAARIRFTRSLSLAGNL